MCKAQIMTINREEDNCYSECAMKGGIKGIRLEEIIELQKCLTEIEQVRCMVIKSVIN